MLTLFWLFFMSVTFIIRIDVPDSRSVAHDASLEAAGESVFQYGLGLEAEVLEGNRLTELLSNSDYNGACALLQDALMTGKEANCWLAKNSATSSRRARRRARHPLVRARLPPPPFPSLRPPLPD